MIQMIQRTGGTISLPPPQDNTTPSQKKTSGTAIWEKHDKLPGFKAGMCGLLWSAPPSTFSLHSNLTAQMLTKRVAPSEWQLNSFCDVAMRMLTECICEALEPQVWQHLV